jgi:hypothetical protein
MSENTCFRQGTTLVVPQSAHIDAASAAEVSFGISYAYSSSNI